MHTVVPLQRATLTQTGLRTLVMRERSFAARKTLVDQARGEHLHLLVSGLAGRCHLLSDGRRQITGLILPGELCDLGAQVRPQVSASVVALSHCVLGEIPRSAVFESDRVRPACTQFVIAELARETTVTAEWLVSLGRRSAYERMAHLFCELWTRLHAIGMTDGMSFDLGMTQVDLADVLGMTSVHVSRVLKMLSKDGLLKFSARRATILDHDALCRAAAYEPVRRQHS